VLAAEREEVAFADLVRPMSHEPSPRGQDGGLSVAQARTSNHYMKRDGSFKSHDGFDAESFATAKGSAMHASFSRPLLSTSREPKQLTQMSLSVAGKLNAKEELNVSQNMPAKSSYDGDKLVSVSNKSPRAPSNTGHSDSQNYHDAREYSTHTISNY